MPRDRQLLAERDRRIATIYHELDREGLRFERIVSTLCSTFLLSEYRVMAIIRRMVKEGTFVDGEPVLPIRRKRKNTGTPKIVIQMELFG